MATSPRGSLPPVSRLAAEGMEQDRISDLIRLQKATQKINSILDLDQLIERVVNDIAESFGCVECSVFLRDEADPDTMVLAAVRGCDQHRKGDRIRIGVEGMVGHVSATGELRYAPDVSMDPYYISCGENIRSEVDIPLKVAGEVIGVFNAAHPALDAFPPDQLQLLQGLAGHVAIAVDNARHFRRERQQNERLLREATEARQIQEALLPKSSPYIPGFAVSGMSVPAGIVGGDWYDFIPLCGGAWGLVLADVSGKGMAAALLMSATRGILRSLAASCDSPAEVLSKLNRHLLDDFPAGKYVTLLYGVLNPTSSTLTFANAGHPAPLLSDWMGVRTLESESGTPLGMVPTTFSEHHVKLSAGSRLLFYSDGISESADAGEEEYGLAHLERLILRPGLTAEHVLDEARSFAGKSTMRDDATVILVESRHDLP